MSPTHRPGQLPIRKVRIYLKPTVDGLDAEVSEHLGNKLHHLEQLLGGPVELAPPLPPAGSPAKRRALEERYGFGRRTVRILFNHATQLGWVKERVGSFAVCDLTEGFVSLSEAEDLAALYAAARELPVSRVDVP